MFLSFGVGRRLLFLSFASGLSLSLVSCSSISPSTSLATSSATSIPVDPDLREPAQQAGSGAWYLSGYLPERPQEKVYLRIQLDRIVSLESRPPPPGSRVLETDSWIFPGLMDLHGHVKYNILPLWPDAKSQFLNRFEWRQKYAPYKDATSLNMKPIKGHVTCAAVRWAELKALAGGATAIQGIGTDQTCAVGYGVRNIDVQDELGDRRKIRNLVDIVDPGYIGNIFLPYGFEKRMAGGLSYDAAFESFMKEETFGGGMTLGEWFEMFKSPERDLASGLRLLVGDALNVPARDVSEASFRKIEPTLRHRLSSEYKLTDPKKVAETIEKMRVFLFGKGATKGYLQVKGPGTDEQAADFLSKGGVLTIPSSVRRFIGMWEFPARRSVQRFFRETPKPTMFVHLAEGRRDDAYNQLEWKYLKKYGLDFPGMILIHGVGMSEAEIREAAQKKISFVWSPFSNLLLYGETLRVDAAVRAGAIVSLGSDWSPTGSKNILDELRLARAYARQQGWNISDKQFVDMVTVNAAKALRIDDRFGKVAPGFMADLTLVSRSPGKANAYEALVTSVQEDVQLVVVRGEAVFGDAGLIRQFPTKPGDSALVEEIELERDCRARKAYRHAWSPDYDRNKAAEAPILTVEQISKLLRETKARYRATLKPADQSKIAPLDLIFACADPAYSKRFANYVDHELPANVRSRNTRRIQDRLQSNWSPLKSPIGEDDDEAAEREEL